MPRKFTPKRIRNTRSGKATVRRPDSIMGKGTKISGLDTETIRQHIDNVDMTPRAMSQAIGDVINAATQPFQMDDNVIPLANYQKAGKHYSPNFTGDETTYFEMYPDEITRLPRKWRNRVNMTLWKNPDNWTLDSGVVMRYVGDNTMKVTGFDNGAGTTVLSPDNLEAITGRTFCGQVEVWCDPADAGDAINIYYGRANGGSSVGSLLTVTLSVEKKTYHFDAWTGNASNIGDVFLIQQPSAGTAPVSLYFRIPHLEEVTNLSNQTSSQPVWGDDSKQELITDGTFSNDPEIPYVRFDGSTGNFLTLPNGPWANGTDFTWRFVISPNNMAGNNETFAGSWVGGSNSWVLKTDGSGFVQVALSDDGSTANFSSPGSTLASLGYSSGDWIDYKIDYRESDRRVRFFHRPYGSTRAYAQHGTDQTSGATSIFTSTTNIELGTYFNGTLEPYEGKMNLFEMFHGLDNSTERVAHFNAANFNGNYLIDADHNMFEPAARHDIEGEWTQTGTGDVTEVASNNNEIAINGYFDTDVSDWTDSAGATASWSNGTMVVTRTAAFNSVKQAHSNKLTVGEWYRFTVEVVADSVKMVIFPSTGTSGTRYINEVVGVGTHTWVFQATAVDCLIYFENTSATGSYTVDNVSLRPFALDGRTGYGQNTVLNAVKAPGRYVSGVELVSNGTFDADSDWTKGAGWTISGGKAVSTAAASNLSQDIGMTVGNAYRITFTLSDYSAGSVVVFAGGSGPSGAYSANGTYEVDLVCLGDSSLYIAAGGPNFTGSIDNVSVKEIIYDLPRLGQENPTDEREFRTDRTSEYTQTFADTFTFVGDGYRITRATGDARAHKPTGISLEDGKVYTVAVEATANKAGQSSRIGVSNSLSGQAYMSASQSITQQRSTYYHTFCYDTATQSASHTALWNGATNSDVTYHSWKIYETDPNFWFRNDGLPTQGSNGKLELDRAGSGFAILQRPLDLSSYSPGDVLAVSVTTEAQSNYVSLYFTRSDQTTTQKEFAMTTAGRRVWYHVLTQADIDDTAFLTLSATNSTTATATVLDVSIRKFTGSFTVLDDTDADAFESRWTDPTITIPTSAQEYVRTVVLSQATSDVVSLVVGTSGGTSQFAHIKYTFSTDSIAEVSRTLSAATYTSNKNKDGIVEITITYTSDATNTGTSIDVYSAEQDAASTGSVNLHSVSLTGANWTPNGNLIFNTDDWDLSIASGTEAVAGIYDGHMYLCQGPSTSYWLRVYQTIAVRSGVEYTATARNAVPPEGSTNMKLSVNTGTSPATTGSLVDDSITSASVENFSGTFTADAANVTISVVEGGAAGKVSKFDVATLQESSYGLGTSRYMNNALVFGDGTVTYDEFSYLKLDGTGGEYAQKANPFTKQLDEIEVIAQVCPTIGTTISVVNQWAGGGNSAWMLRVTTSGFLQSLVSADGSTDVSSAATTALTSGQLVWVKWNFSVAAQVSNYYRSYDDPTLAPEAVANWASIGTDIAHAQTEIYQSTADIQVGARNSGGGSDPYDGLVGQILIKDNIDVPQETERFTPATAIADGWAINSVGSAQIKTNTLIPLHRYEDEQLHDDYAVVQVPGRYKHFTTSEALEVGNARLPSLANATHPNGGGIYCDVAALPNLLAPAARVDFTEWGQVGTGSITPVGDGVELVGDSSFELDDGSWTELNTSTVYSGGSVTCTNTIASAGVIRQSIAVEEGEWYRIRVNPTNGTASGRLSVDSVGAAYTGDLYAGQPTPDQDTYILIKAITNNLTIGLYTNSSTAGHTCTWNELSVQKLSYTTLSDEDDTGGEAIWTTQLTIPSDNETYVYEWTYSPGTSTGDLGVRLRLSGGTAIDVQYGYNQSTGVLTEQINTNSLGVVTATANSDGTTTFRVQTTDTGANTTATLYLWQQGANVQGTFNVHGDVVIQRLSAQAEPAWNTLKPGDSVTNLVTNAQDFSTGWTDGLTSKAQDQTDMRGNANSAWTLTDNNAGGYASISQDNITISGETKYYCMTVPVKKVSSQQDYPQIRINTNNPIQNNNFDCDPYLGRTYNRGAGTEEYASGCIDGAWLQAMFPDVYPNASNYWIFYAVVYDDSGFTDIDAHISPAYSQTFGGSPVAASTGSIVVDSVTLHEGRFPYFFDSISTSAQVTEEIQDWSKIFTFLAEGSNNVANMVFTHGHHKLLGFENVTALTNEIGTPYHINTTEADWTAGGGSYSIQADTVSIFPGESAVEVTGTGVDSAYSGQQSGTFTASAETAVAIIEGGSSLPTLSTLNITDATLGQNVNRISFTWATGIVASINSPAGTSPKQWSIPLGVGPNGGALWAVYAQGVASSPGNVREIRIYPVGDSGDHDSGDSVIIHYVGHVASDVVSILPFDGTRVAHSTWEYDTDNLFDPSGTLVSDLIPTLDKADMDMTANNVIAGVSAGSAGTLMFGSNENMRTWDGVTTKETTAVVSGQDVARAVVAWSESDNEQTIQGATVNGSNEDASGITYDGTLVNSVFSVFEDMQYEFFMPQMAISKQFQNSAERTATAEYHRND